MLVGRKKEIRALEDRNSRPQAQFIAVYGRRRVGKTYLVQQFFQERAAITMEVVGEHGAKLSDQLVNFRLGLERAFGRVHSISSWKEAFQALAGSLARVQGAPRSVLVFLDEFPWMETHRSGLVQSLGYAWETELKKFPWLRLVICGSAASWMTSKVINHRGSLHNRVTELLKLEPFRLADVEHYFEARDIPLTRDEVLELYLVLGGLPYYLDYVRRGESPAQAVGRICFGNGPLVGERDRLFRALFSNHQRHDLIVEALAQRRGGLTRAELTGVAGLGSGGYLTTSLNELVQSGFVALAKDWRGKKKETRYVLVDPFLMFYFRCMRPLQGDLLEAQLAEEQWHTVRTSQSFASMQGYAFENCCRYHVSRVRAALGLSSVQVRPATWRRRGAGESRGGQIDLLFDRDDGRITLCEMKHHPGGFVVDRAYADWVMQRADIFKKDTRTRKNVDNVLLCSHGARDNSHLRRAFSRVITLDDLF